MKLEYFRQIFEKYSNIKLYENCPVVATCSMRTDGLADITKIMIAFCSFANAPGMEKNMKLNVTRPTRRVSIQTHKQGTPVRPIVNWRNAHAH